MTVAEMIKALKKLPGDVPLVVELRLQLHEVDAIDLSVTSRTAVIKLEAARIEPHDIDERACGGCGHDRFFEHRDDGKCVLGCEPEACG